MFRYKEITHCNIKLFFCFLFMFFLFFYILCFLSGNVSPKQQIATCEGSGSNNKHTLLAG